MMKSMNQWLVFALGLVNLCTSDFLRGYPPCAPSFHLVPITLMQGAAAKGAVCLDGSVPAYHLDPGFGPGANNWLVHLEGGGWCKDEKTCSDRKRTPRGSSNYMEKEILFTGILTNNPEENPDFYNWNRVKIRYCDGASFAGDAEDKVRQLQFRGQRIFSYAIEELKSKGMRDAEQVLLSGCSAGGLAVIIHCDQFGSLFANSTRVKCFSDGGLILDTVDVGGGHSYRNIFSGVVNLQGVGRNLPKACTNRLDPTSCFYSQNLIGDIKTPLFILNAAYDSYQIRDGLAPPSADPKGIWNDCRNNYTKCQDWQIEFLQGFRQDMVDSVKGFLMSNKTGIFLNSCFTHCQSEPRETWFPYANPPTILNKTIAESVGDWYFDRAQSKAVDYPYPSNRSCCNLLFKDGEPFQLQCANNC